MLSYTLGTDKQENGRMVAKLIVIPNSIWEYIQLFWLVIIIYKTTSPELAKVVYITNFKTDGTNVKYISTKRIINSVIYFIKFKFAVITYCYRDDIDSSPDVFVG